MTTKKTRNGGLPYHISASRLTGFLDRQRYMAPVYLILAGLSPLASASDQSGDDFVAPAAPAQEEIAEPAPAAPAEPAAAAPAAAAAAPATAGAASAEVPTQTLERVRVTGSAIARTDAETAVPVTVIEAEEIKQQGVTSTEQLVAQLTSNDTSAGPGLATGGEYTGGASFANLRGLGTDKTLVLLNGRRLANNSLDGSSVDLNSIPFGAIRRVEVLRDGASALYGTDAIGGVINFITYENRQGGEIEFGYEEPTRSGGGETGDISATWGNGDLDEDGFNFMGSLSYRGQDALQATDREGIRKVYDPDRGINATSAFPFPANYLQSSTGIFSNPLANSGCNSPGLVDTGGTTCRYDYGRYGQMVQETEKTSLYTQLSVALAEDHTASLSYLWSRNNSISISAPAPSSALPELQPGTPFYPDDPALDPTQPVDVYWRSIPGGVRKTDDTVDAKRVMLDFEGAFSAFDYSTAVGWNRSDTELEFRGGYLDDQILEDAFNNGVIDPFSTTLTEAGERAIAEAQVTGKVQDFQNDVYFWNGQLSRELGDWFGAGSTAMAVGGEYRHERLQLDTDRGIAGSTSSSGLSPDAQFDEDRDVKGIFTELNVPIIDGLELTGAVRYDDYSDAGDTTNPKISFRYQPIQQLLFRGAYSEGFRAPSLYELYDPNSLTYTPAGLNDPVLCPGGNVAPDGIESRDCNNQFERQLGGNAELVPEEAKNWTLGTVIQPFSNFSASLDFWWVEVENQVAAPSADYVLENEPGNIVRNPDGSIDYIVTTNANLGTTKTNGVDIAANYRLDTSSGVYSLGLTGTYVDRYDFQENPDVGFTDNLDKYVAGYGNQFSWKHKITFNWANGPWGAGLINHFQTGYDDYDTETNAEVDSYTTWDALGAYTFVDGPTITVGVKNLLDEDPPFSNQPEVGQIGYDTRYADALGRTVYARFNYTF